MKKVYAIIRGNGDILVGSGGKSGKKQLVRAGLHLPGGTCDPSESIITAALREVKEETGICLLEEDKIDSFCLELNGVEVNFVVFEVFSVDDEIKKRSAPSSKNPYDQPFEFLHSLPFKKCIGNPEFSAKYQTDWFAAGLKYAYEHKML